MDRAPHHFRNFALPEGLTDSDRICILQIAEALSRRDGWGDKRCGPEQSKYLERAIRALNDRMW